MKLIPRMDTPENRAFWEFVFQTAAIVKSHTLCYSNHCVAPETPCVKRKDANDERPC